MTGNVREPDSSALNAAEIRVAVLYADPAGVYSGVDGVDLWDEARDARLYAGPWPVVAHPPCQRWCRFAKGIETRYGYKIGDDDGCFYAALDAVKTYGGVLEHPARSLAWDSFGLPKPQSTGGWTYSFLDGGASCYVEQGRYGHRARKATWLYAYGVELPVLRWGRRIDAEAGTHKWGSYLYKRPENHMRPRMSASELPATPPLFRDVLLEIARSAKSPTVIGADLSTLKGTG